MKKNNVSECTDEKDLLHHLMEEQIAFICVDEEEERMRAELSDGNKQV